MGDLGLSWHEFTSLKSQFGCSSLIFMPVLGLVHNTKRKLGRGARRTPTYIHFGGVDISVGGLGSTPSVRILDSTSALCTGFLACVCVSVSFASSTMRYSQDAKVLDISAGVSFWSLWLDFRHQHKDDSPHFHSR
jgi:hypothetical protein